MIIDAYRADEKIIIWKKTNGVNVREEHEHTCKLYFETKSIKHLKRLKIPYRTVNKKSYLGKTLVLASKVNPKYFHGTIKRFEKETKYRLKLFNADIKPEQSYLYDNNITPLEKDISLSSINIKVYPKHTLNGPIARIIVNDQILDGSERIILEKFKEKFDDPDILFFEYAYSRLPYLIKRLKRHGMALKFHRWDPEIIEYKGGKSFFSYGNVTYRDFAIKLRGRILIDTSTPIGSLELKSILMLVRLSGSLIQDVCSRSYGFIFQTALIRNMYKEKLLIPYKEKPIDRPQRMNEFFKNDRAGHTFDAKIGFHRNVCAIDFSSMYPHIMHNFNVSAETILKKSNKKVKVPTTNIEISHDTYGLIPKTIKPFIDSKNKTGDPALKMVLVSSNGYLRFREFKLGVASSHMAVCAYSREILINSARYAEKYGYEVLHGIIDSLFLKGDSDKIEELCKKLEIKTTIPIKLDGVFKWIVFLPSVNDDSRPVPTRYFGVYTDGKVKVRGIELRQHSSPLLIKKFQSDIINIMKDLDKPAIKSRIKSFAKMINKYLESPSTHDLTISLRIGKEEYKNNIPQKIVTKRLNKMGIAVMPGQKIKYIQTLSGPRLTEEYNDDHDKIHYKKLLIRALHSLVQVFGYSREQLEELAKLDRQTTLLEY